MSSTTRKMGSIGRKLSLYLVIGWIFTFSSCESPAIPPRRSFITRADVRVRNNKIYVKPNDSNSALCPADSCHILDWYAINGSDPFNSDTTMVFLEGTHSLTTIVNVSSCRNLAMYGKQQSVRISCNTSDAAFLFSNCSNVVIENLTFESCGAKLGAALSFQQGANITLSHISVKYATGYGLITNNVLGLISIEESKFSKTKKVPHIKHCAHARLCFGSKCGKNSSTLSNNHTTKVTILSSQFVDGQKNVSGLEIFLHAPNTFVVVDNVTFRNNSGGNLVLAVTYLVGNTHDTSIFKILNSRLYMGQAKFGAGMHLMSYGNATLSINDDLCPTYVINILEVHNTTFQSNNGSTTGGAAYITQFQGRGCNQIIRTVIFKNCSFIENIGNGAVMEISKHRILVDHPAPVLNVSFENCTFRNNSVHNDVMGPIMNIQMSHIVMLNCNFTNNSGTAISLRKSNLNFHNDIRFVNNRADYGAALKVCEGSTIFLHKRSNVHFINNSALMGGAVYAQQACMDTAPSCIFQPVLRENVSIEDFNSSLALTFANNSANFAGDAIYGGSLDRCYTLAKYSFNGTSSGSYFNYPEIFRKIFNMTGQLGPSWVSSNPRGVCFCGDNEKIPQKYHCRTNHPVVEVYPGARFTISAVVVGQFNGTTIGTIDAKLSEGNGKLIKHHETEQSRGCVNLTYSIVLFKKTLSKFTLELNTTTGVMAVNSNLKPFPINYSVSLVPCPLGFELIVEPSGNYKCGCGPLFKWYKGRSKYSFKCNITTQVISVDMHKATMWLGRPEQSNGSQCEQLMVSSDCDYYCSKKNYDFNLTSNVSDDNVMCLSGREGILCGACKSGYSQVLGSLKTCRKCSNKMLLFFIPCSLLSGILLVFFLAILNITVTEGTINGLIFYATVLYADLSIIPNGHNYAKGIKPLKIFISWLNLHWGFEVCAYDGMDAYQYIWLLFGYVFYLMLIQGFIIFLSRRFIFCTRLFGKNVLKILATVLFLLHSQIVYACFSTFQQAILRVLTSDNTIAQKVVWYYDGNLPYFGLKHAVLFVLAIVCSLITIVFMLSLLLTQCLNKWTDYWFLHWFCRLKPFYEAFTGPCNNNYQFWPGFLYVTRSALCGVTMYISNYRSHLGRMKMIFTCLVCILIMLLACIFPRGVYKKWPINVLEFSFILNLCITSIILGSTHTDSVLLVSIPSAMLSCAGIVLYHAYQQCKSTRGWKKFSVCTHKIYKRKSSTSIDVDQEEEKELLLPQALPPVINFKDFREPLLED